MVHLSTRFCDSNGIFSFQIFEDFFLFAPFFEIMKQKKINVRIDENQLHHRDQRVRYSSKPMSECLKKKKSNKF